MAEERVQVSLSKDLYDKVVEKVREGVITSVEDFIDYAVVEALEKLKSPYSPEDEEKVKERLKALGYI